MKKKKLSPNQKKLFLHNSFLQKTNSKAHFLFQLIWSQTTCSGPACCIFRHKLHVPVTESPFQGKWVNWLEPGLVSNAKRRLQFTRQFNQLKLHRKDFPPISPSSSFPHNSNSFTTWTGRGNVLFLTCLKFKELDYCAA